MATVEDQINTLTASVLRLERRCKVLAWLLGVSVLFILCAVFIWDRFGKYLGRTSTAVEFHSQLMPVSPDPTEELFRLNTRQNLAAVDAAKKFDKLNISVGYRSPKITAETDVYERRERGILYRGQADFEIRYSENGARAVVYYWYSRKSHKWVTSGWELQRAWGRQDDVWPEIYEVMKQAFGEARPNPKEP